MVFVLCIILIIGGFYFLDFFFFLNIFTPRMSDVERSAIFNEAVLRKDLSLCNKLPEVEWVNHPRDACIVNVLVAIGDGNLCNNRRYSQDCIERIAIAKSDVRECHKINHEIYRSDNERELFISSCYYLVIVGNHRFDDCNILTIQDTDRCYHEAAMYRKDILVCQKIKEIDLRNTCISDIKMYFN